MRQEEVLQRESFINRVDEAYNVIAPAGSGKTYAIVRRVENLIRKTQRKVLLLTYTNKAAEEMKVRLDQLLTNFIYDPQRLFVGTIHSFCIELINKYAHLWGVVAPVEVSPNIEKLRGEYLSEVGNPLDRLPERWRAIFEKHFELFSASLVESVEAYEVDEVEFCEPPVLNLSDILAEPLKGRSSLEMRNLKRWAQRFVEEGGWSSNLSVPERPGNAKASALYAEVLGEYEQWKSKQGLLYAQYLAQDFKQWRLRNSQLSYDDLIDLVYEKLEPGEDWSVVLDEAQDTSDKQLEILERLATQKDNKIDFSLVGDPQQSIYGSRASLDFYQKTVERLANEHGVVNITFETTFRCDGAVVNWVNGLGPDLLDGKQGQADYVQLNLRDDAKAGNVLRWGVEKLDGVLTSEQKHQKVAQQIAQKISQQVTNFDAAHRIAVIAPRRKWLHTIATELKKIGIPHQLYDNDESSQVARRILNSVVHLLTYPADSFELIGLLREIFAIEDIVLGQAYKKNPETFNLSCSDIVDVSDGALKSALILLKQAWEKAASASLAIALRVFCEQVDLRGRVCCMEGIVGEDLQSEYDRVLSAMVIASQSVNTLAELVDLQIDSAQEIKPGHLQLLTMHKAKGLEWDVVIMPYLSRKISQKNPSYPSVQKDSGGKEYLAYHKEQVDRERLHQKGNQELKRLLYVAFTRARNTLVLVDDSAVYGIEDDSAAQLCGLGAQAKTQWDDLAFDIPLPELSVRQVCIEQVRGNPWEVVASAPQELITPSEHAVEHKDFQKKAKGGSMYGSDWHDAWALLKPGMSPDEVKTFLLERARGFEQNQRGVKEFEKLFETVDLSKLLGYPFWTEVSLLVELPEGVLEGRLDMVAQTEDGLWIVDWKTDHLDPEELVESYRRQILLYRQGLEVLQERPVRASLYSSVHGKWIHFEGESFEIV